jgi:hypothetical protein
MEMRIGRPFSSSLRGIRMLSIVPQEGTATKCHHNQSAWSTFTVSVKVNVGLARPLSTIYGSGGPSCLNFQSGPSEKDSDSLSVHIRSFESRRPL